MTEHATRERCASEANGGIINEKGATTYLPVVASNGTSDGRQRLSVVEALHVFVADLRDESGVDLVGGPPVGAAG
jgi:hypothetical protein